ncbi:signal recognition particle-docking protein FtsY [uncultured Corynebacterium sp.]|uniref:signal recognition particle-docking protein FtsY n=1 Tax=uncultured Corynebacterium sp. TaxID=159447 RepID=UPI0025CD8EBE|nr:signal recognition particle-docking protein FtsY [uncultured Corynebacterium sp.]
MTTTYLWIAIAVIVLILLAIVLVVLGKKRGESKKVSFDKPVEEPKELTQQQKSGNYQAKSGFNFAPAGGSAEKQPAEKPAKTVKADEATPAKTQPTQAAQAQPDKNADKRDATELANAQLNGTQKTEKNEKAEPAEPVKAKEAEAPEETKNDEGSESAAGAVAAGAASAAAAGAAVPGAVAGDMEEREEDARDAEVADAPKTAEAEPATETTEITEITEATEPAVSESVVDGDKDAGIEEDAGVEEDAANDDAATEEAAAAAGEQTASASAALEAEPEELQVSDDAEVVEAPAQPQDDIAPASGRLGKLRGRLSRSQNAIGQGLMGILSAGDLDDDAWEDIEDTLIMADLGTKPTMKVTDSLREKIAERGVSSEEEARAMLREALIEVGHPEMDRSIKAMPNDGKPAVIMVVGVNGTGKTTTTGKLARVLVSMGHNVLLGAADTFRAAAADQLETWGRRVGASTVRGKEGADPASVAFDAVAAGVDQGVDVVLVDTAGRLHTSVDLMDQLGKVKRVVEKKTEVDEVLLVLDATVGQNGLTQARIFRDVVDITGVVLTKLDGTAKGGIVFQVQEELGVPVKLVGLGEGADDLAPFEVEGFVDALLGEK